MTIKLGSEKVSATLNIQRGGVCFDYVWFYKK
jgi:hypothetical protein